MGIPVSESHSESLDLGGKLLAYVDQVIYTYSLIHHMYLWMWKMYRCVLMNSAKNLFNYNPWLMTCCYLSCVTVSIYLFNKFSQILGREITFMNLSLNSLHLPVCFYPIPFPQGNGSWNFVFPCFISILCFNQVLFSFSCFRTF